MTTVQVLGPSASTDDSLPTDVAQLCVISRQQRQCFAARIGTSAFLWHAGRKWSEGCVRGGVEDEEPRELRVRAMAVDHEGGLLLAAEEGGIFRTPGPLAAARQLPIPAASFVQLACGGSHCLALTQAGVVWSWGGGSSGQLGHGDGETTPTPKRLDLQPEGPAELPGRGPSRGPSHPPTPVASFRRLRKLEVMRARGVAAGRAHSAVVTVRGALYVFGAGGDGQLGLGLTTRADGLGSSLPLALDPLRRPHWTPTLLGPPPPTVVEGAAKAAKTAVAAAAAAAAATSLPTAAWQRARAFRAGRRRLETVSVTTRSWGRR